MSSLHKIFSDSINGPQSIDSLSISEQLTLITIHNKKFIEALVECGCAFDLYVMDNQKHFEFLSNTLGASAEEGQIIEMNNIYAGSSTFLFPDQEVGQDWIENLISLHNKGYLNFPPRQLDKANLLNRLQEATGSKIARSELVSYPVLIPTLNKISCGVQDAERHFMIKTPQYARYAEAILIVKNNPKAMKSIHDVFSSLIYVDEALTNYVKSTAAKLMDEMSDESLQNFLTTIKLDVDESELSERELNEKLQTTKINMLLNWLFNSGKLNKVERVDFLKRLTLHKGNLKELRGYISENKLSLV